VPAIRELVPDRGRRRDGQTRRYLAATPEEYSVRPLPQGLRGCEALLRIDVILPPHRFKRTQPRAARGASNPQFSLRNGLAPRLAVIAVAISAHHAASRC
jgi:hypothetical protein